MKVVDSLNVKKAPKVKNPIDKKAAAQPVLVFFVTFFVYLVLLLINGLIPFGETYLLISDLKAQFAPYLILFKNHIRELDFSALGSSFTYTTVLAGGKNFMGTFGYYMGSPLNWLVFLFEDYQIDYAIILIIGTKISLAASFMSIFLRRRVADKKSIWPVVFGITYGFTSYAIAFLFAIIWLDGYALLPLILYFTEKLIDERKKAGLVVTLILLFVSNLYVSYMVGIFSFFYLVFRLFYKVSIEQNMNIKQAVNTAIRFVLTAVICIFTLGVLILPVGLNILQNRDVLIDTAESDSITFKGIEILNQIFLGNVGEFNVTLHDNMPFIFVSLLFTLLIIIFFVSKVFSKKEKYYYGTILILIYLSFNIAFLDIAWQAFDVPNWFCHRFSFVFFPVFYMIAIQTIEKIKEITSKDITKATLILIAFALISQSFGDLATSGFNFIVNIAFILGYMLLLLAMKKEKWHEQLKNMQRLSKYIIVIVLIFESSGINSGLSGDISSYVSGGSSAKYEDEVYLLMTSVDALENSCNRVGIEEGYYNPDIEISVSDESALLANYNSINIFDSNSNKAFGRFMKQLGYATSYNYFFTGYNYTAQPTNAFFSIPVVLMNDDAYSGQLINDLEIDESEVYTYFTGKVLPMGFAVDKSALNFDFYQLEKKEFSKDYFKFQNEWYKSMFPGIFTENFYNSYRVIKDTDITIYNGEYYPLDKVGLDIDPLSSIDPTSLDNSEKAFQKRNAIVRTGASAPVAIEITYEVKETGEQYFAVVADRILDDMTILVDGKEHDVIAPGSYYSRIIRLGYYEEGDVITVLIKSNREIFSYQDFYFATIDTEVFENQLAQVDAQKVITDTFETGHMEFTTNFTENDILLTSVPYEDGWTCYVDGVETEITPYQNALIAVDPGVGTHKVELKFLAPGIKAGLCMSAVGVISMALFFVIDNKKKNNLSK